MEIRRPIGERPGFRWLTGLGRLLDEPDDSLGMRDHRDMAGGDLDHGGAHSLGKLRLRLRRNGLVVFGDEIPRGKRLPCRGSHHVAERGPGQSLLHGVHDLRLDGVDVGSEVIDEIVLGEPAETLLVGEDVLERWCHGPLGQQRAEGLALVEPEGCDVDQTDDVGCVVAQGRHDLTAVGVSDDDGRTVLERQHLAQAGDIVCQRRHWKLRCDDPKSVGLEPLDDGAPAGPVSPCAVDQNDVRFGSHFRCSFLSGTW